MIFSVWTPNPNPQSGGIRVLWRFIELLIESGNEVYAFYATTKPEGSRATLRSSPHPEGVIVIPDVAPPIEGRCVARWNLAYPGAWQGNTTVKSRSNEIVFHYNDHFKEASIQSSFHKCSHELYVGVLEPELFRNVKKIPKIVDKFYVGKGDQFGVRFGSTRIKAPAGAIPLTPSASRQKWIDGIAEAKNLYVYDTVTAVTLEGHLAGCKVFHVDEEGKEWKSWSDLPEAQNLCEKGLKNNFRDLESVKNFLAVMKREFEDFSVRAAENMEIKLKDNRTNRLDLRRVTCAIADCVNFKQARRTLQHCINLCEFGDAKFFTHEIPDQPDPYIVNIPKISSKQDYSHFIVKELGNYIKTDFVLVIQTDGFIVNIDKWTDEFLKYDYIGAPWHVSQLKPNMNPNHLVGNGGFSLRSRRLQEFLMNDPNIQSTHPEDVIICQTYRKYLEEKGFQFCPERLAHQFSCENYVWNNAFGHHAYFYLHGAR